MDLLFSLASYSFAAPSIEIHYAEYAQVELINSKGTRILIDVFDPSRLSRPATSKDILLTTHTASDHTNFWCEVSSSMLATLGK
jgi:hypothetical protein